MKLYKKRLRNVIDSLVLVIVAFAILAWLYYLHFPRGDLEYISKHFWEYIRIGFIMRFYTGLAWVSLPLVIIFVRNSLISIAREIDPGFRMLDIVLWRTPEKTQQISFYLSVAVIISGLCIVLVRWMSPILYNSLWSFDYIEVYRLYSTLLFIAIGEVIFSRMRKYAKHIIALGTPSSSEGFQYSFPFKVFLLFLIGTFIGLHDPYFESSLFKEGVWAYAILGAGIVFAYWALYKFVIPFAGEVKTSQKSSAERIADNCNENKNN